MKFPIYERLLSDPDYQRQQGVMGRGSRRAVGDYRRRYRAQMRAAARCNAFAAARWNDARGRDATFDRGRAMTHAILNAARRGRSAIRS